MDVRNAFLNGMLSKEVYMKSPPGTSPPSHKVCHLRRALYGLKQAPRAWFVTFSSTITQLCFAFSPHDTTLFTGQTPHGILLLLLYVDDMIITGDNPQAISDLQHYLGQHFEMKDFGSLKYFLGLEVSRRLDGYLFSQAKYAYDLLVHSGITESNTTLTTLDSNVHLTPFAGVPLEDVSSYRQLVGDPTDQRSTTGYCFYLGDSLISWHSKKQSVVSCSGTESEYRALADATAKLLWLRWLFTDMGVL
ncbi:hypothetical protein IC575_025692 [Cucumis melo]